MRKMLGLVFIIIMGILLSSCATILSGHTQKINVTTSSGKQATALVDGQRYTVPSVIDVDRQNKDIMVANEKCPNQQVILNKSVNSTFWVNILSGGAFGSTTDAATGDMWSYQPENVVLPKCSSK